MAESAKPLLRSQNPPSPFWYYTLFGTTTLAGLGLTLYQGASRGRDSSWSGLVSSLLLAVTSVAGLVATRNWSKWSRSENAPTEKTYHVSANQFQHTVTVSEVSQEVLDLFAKVEQIVSQLLPDDSDEKEVDHIEESPEEEESDLLPQPLQARLETVVGKLHLIVESSAKTDLQIEELTRSVEVFRKEFEARGYGNMVVETSDSGGLLAKMAELQRKLEEVRSSRNTSRAGSNMSSQHTSPLRSPGFVMGSPHTPGTGPSAARMALFKVEDSDRSEET